MKIMACLLGKLLLKVTSPKKFSRPSNSLFTNINSASQATHNQKTLSGQVLPLAPGYWIVVMHCFMVCPNF